MKRQLILQPLSQEHHHALVVAKRLLEKAQHSPNTLVDYWLSIRDEFTQTLLAHFKEEEARFKNLLIDELWTWLISDHRELRQLLATQEPERIVQLACKLKAHIRFEERELFSWLEQHKIKPLEARFHALK